MKKIGLPVLGIFAVTAFYSPALYADPADAPAAVPDNTKTNVRDRNANTPTADQAKENPSDREVMRKIRRAVIADKSLSVYAHNVKIIAIGGNVTLKGPVHTDAEKTAIGQKAADVVGADHVTNDISVTGS